MDILLETKFTYEEAVKQNKLIFKHYYNEYQKGLIFNFVVVIFLLSLYFYTKDFSYILLALFTFFYTSKGFFSYIKLIKENKNRIKKLIQNTPDYSILTYKFTEEGIIYKDFHCEYFFKWSYFEYFQILGPYLLLLPLKDSMPTFVIIRKTVHDEIKDEFNNYILTHLKRKK